MHVLLIGVNGGELAKDYVKQSPAIANINALKQTLLTEVDDLRGDQITTLIDPNLWQMRHAIALMTYRCRHDDLCLIYYTGCGVIDARTGSLYLSANDTKLDTLSTSTLSSDYIRHALPSLQAGLSRVMILDCMWGALPPQPSPAPPIAQQNSQQNSSRLSATQLADCNCALFTALGSNAQPWPRADQGLSLYTHCLIEGITTGLADVDADGGISLGDLQTYMAQALEQTSLEIFPLACLGDSGDAQAPLWPAQTYTPEREYHRSVVEYAQRHRGHIAPAERNILEFLRHQLGITLQQAQAIETEVITPYAVHQEHCDRYRHALITALELETPLGTPLKKWLRHLQGELSLSYEEVSNIEAQVCAHPQAQHHLPQQQNLSRWLTPLATPKLVAASPERRGNGHANGQSNNDSGNSHIQGQVNDPVNGHASSHGKGHFSRIPDH
ncbi:hypothetical protein [Leptothoe sp. PORK10 BA2]|uniref:hypothetical protein n=1 Tax=Leptothoe sp. PORK10 BA2 TaxID=3110254 RepID=UPI002B2192BB|nr:hypothetical protein [Leptothoe sp. PORK10 BA2]MEA5463701.1 hypothetical protein [Leptothoe sp. PORK10 BA2]